jgi:hypothetical protein
MWPTVAGFLHAVGLPDLEPGWLPPTARPGPVQEFSASMHRAVTAMARYSADIASILASPACRQPTVPGTWPHVSIQAREAIQNASAFLQSVPSTGPLDSPPAAYPDAHRLDAVTAALTAGLDLLHTHVATRPDGSRLDRSEWAPAVTSAPVTRALLPELGLWARRIAEGGARMALPGPATGRGTGQERYRLNGACQWLWVLDSTVQAAQRHQPVSATEIRLLHAIPRTP